MKSKKFNLVTDQVTQDEIAVLLRELVAIVKKGIAGDIVELGCYEGGSAVAMQQLLQAYNYEKTLWVYDSFEGLPEKTKEDVSATGEMFTAGKLKASKARLQRNFVKKDVKIPEIKRAWFFELDPEDLPPQIALAFLDGDFYESIMDSLKLVWPKLAQGGVIIVDDYANAALPGVHRAVDEFFASKLVTITLEQTLAIIRF